MVPDRGTNDALGMTGYCDQFGLGYVGKFIFAYPSCINKHTVADVSGCANSPKSSKNLKKQNCLANCRNPVIFHVLTAMTMKIGCMP
jgi:hypothetical protein